MQSWINNMEKIWVKSRSTDVAPQSRSSTGSTGSLDDNRSQLADLQSRLGQPDTVSEEPHAQQGQGLGLDFSPLSWDDHPPDTREGKMDDSSTEHSSEPVATSSAMSRTSSKRRSRVIKQPKGTIAYEVSGTETLASIAAQFDTTMSELKKLNKLMSTMVWPTQVIYVPDKDYVPSSPSSTGPSPTSPEPNCDFPSLDSQEGKDEATSATQGRTSKSETSSPAFDIPLVRDRKGPGVAERLKMEEEEMKLRLPSNQEAKQLVEDCSERFIKVNVKHITDGQQTGVVSGVLLVTPNAIMFDPNLSDPLVVERGADEYGMIAPMETIISAAMYHDIAAMKNSMSRRRGEEVSDDCVIQIYHADNCPLSSQGQDEGLADTCKDTGDSGKEADEPRRRCESTCSCGISALTQEELFESVATATGRDGHEAGTVSAEGSVSATSAGDADRSDSSAGKAYHSLTDREVAARSPQQQQLDDVLVSFSLGENQLRLPDDGPGVALSKPSGDPLATQQVDLLDTTELPLTSPATVTLDSSTTTTTKTTTTTTCDGDEKNDSKAATLPGPPGEEQDVNKPDLLSDLPLVHGSEPGASSKDGGGNTDSNQNQVEKDREDSAAAAEEKLTSTPQLTPGRNIGNIQYFQFGDLPAGQDSGKLSPVPFSGGGGSGSGRSSGGASPKNRTSPVGVPADSPGLQGTGSGSGSSPHSQQQQGIFSRTIGSLSSLGSSLPGSPNLSSFVDFSSGLFGGTSGRAAGATASSSSPGRADGEAPEGMRSSWYAGMNGESLSTNVEHAKDISDSVHSSCEVGSSSTRSGLRDKHVHLVDLGLENAVQMKDMPELFQSLDKIIPRPATYFADPPLYLCLRIGTPVKRRVSKTCPIESYMKNKSKPEYWFSIPRAKVDHLYAFFIQWSPNIYGTEEEIDPKERGFVVLGENDGEMEISEDHFESRQMTKDWEIVNVEEARRRISMAEVENLPLPELIERSSIMSNYHIRKLCFNLSARTEGYPWTLIYSSQKNGFSLKTMYRTMLKVDSPILLVVQDTENEIFGALCSCALKMSDHFYGTGESFLFTFYPDFKKYPWVGGNNFFMKGNSESLSIGSGDGVFGLWLDSDLYHGSTHCCQTYDNDMLTSSEDFVIKQVEAWGFV